MELMGYKMLGDKSCSSQLRKIKMFVKGLKIYKSTNTKQEEVLVYGSKCKQLWRPKCL